MAGCCAALTSQPLISDSGFLLLCLLQSFHPSGQEAFIYIKHHFLQSCVHLLLPPLDFFNCRISKGGNRRFYTKKKDTIQNIVAVMVSFHCHLDQHNSSHLERESLSKRFSRSGCPVGMSEGYYPDYINERVT